MTYTVSYVRLWGVMRAQKPNRQGFIMTEQEVHFGTDGWRAIIGEGFTNENLIRTIDASARVFKEDAVAAGKPLDVPGVLYIGYDCRQDAPEYAQLAAEVAGAHGFEVKLSDKYCPTPTLCWSVAQDDEAVGGIMLTSSHNPAEYLGVKLRMADGGASSKEFTDRVEAVLAETPLPTDARGNFAMVDLMTPYLTTLKNRVDTDAIREADLHVVVDPLYGAGRHYLADLLRELGVTVAEIHNDADPTFDGLHPEPIQPWIDACIAEVPALGYDAGFINDGDADRIGAVDEHGNFVNPHRIITLVTEHLAEDKGMTGRVVSTVTASALLKRLCDELGLEFTSTPVGFKWIYGEMQKGDVLLGGEESGGIGIPGHVMERDGLLMALMLCEMMAERGKSLGELVADMQARLGVMEFERRGLSITQDQMDNFRAHTLVEYAPEEVAGKTTREIDRRDGVKVIFDDDSWLMMRPSGTEPLVRIYAEAPTKEDVNALLAAATEVVAD